MLFVSVSCSSFVSFRLFDYEARDAVNPRGLKEQEENELPTIAYVIFREGRIYV
jgi:hypothetical protein